MYAQLLYNVFALGMNCIAFYVKLLPTHLALPRLICKHILYISLTESWFIWFAYLEINMYFVCRELRFLHLPVEFFFNTMYIF